MKYIMLFHILVFAHGRSVEMQSMGWSKDALKQWVDKI